MTSSKPCASVVPFVRNSADESSSYRQAERLVDEQSNKHPLGRSNDVTAARCDDVTPTASCSHDISRKQGCDVTNCRTTPAVALTSNRKCVVCNHVTVEWTQGDIYRQVSECSFYYGRMTSAEATQRLKRTTVGHFLLRDSSDRRYMFTLSVQTNSGPTSVRIDQTRTGLFRLDCDVTQRRHMPTFRSVLELISYYKSNDSTNCYLVDKVQSKNSKICLLAGHNVRPASLQQLARRAVHSVRLTASNYNTQQQQQHTACVDCFLERLPVNDSQLLHYLRQYPFDV